MSGRPDNGNAAPLDQEVEQGIDAIDRLRGTMRRAGMSECADALDHVFVKCLKDYVARKEAAKSGDDEGCTPDGNLN